MAAGTEGGSLYICDYESFKIEPRSFGGMFETPFLKIARSDPIAEMGDKALKGAHSWEGRYDVRP
jgi:hypothetical protein